MDGAQLMRFLRQNISRAPIAFAAEVADPAVLDAFLASFRSRTQDNAAPASQQLVYKGRVYDRIVWPFDPNDPQSITVYCAVMAGQFVLSPCESMVRDVIDQILSNRRPKKAGWLGRDLSLRITERGWKVIEPLLRQRYSAWLENLAWTLYAQAAYHVRSTCFYSRTVRPTWCHCRRRRHPGVNQDRSRRGLST